jgi:nicotinate dehydrogenase subunit B
MRNLTPSRRDVLVAGGALIVSFSLPDCSSSAWAQPTEGKPLTLNEVDSFLAIDPSGAVTIYSGKVDLGTGVRTALTQIAAEELDVPLERVNVIQGNTATTPDQGPTWGSLSIQQGGVQIRQAAATARQALLKEAASRLGVNVSALNVTDGVIQSGENGGLISYGELVGGNRFSLAVNKNAPTKAPSTYTIVGKPVARLDIPAKVTGQFTYMQDFKVSGMLHGRVVRPGGIAATLESVDESSVQGIPGIVKIVREGNFLGVVAETEWAAIKASQQIKAAWSKWEGLPEESKLWDYVRSTKIVKDGVTSNIGNVAAPPPDGARKLGATYDFAIQTHGSIGPSCAIVDIKNGKLSCWTASQATHNLRRQLATMLSMPEESVNCIYVEGSGCYGRNGHEDAAADAALMARATGRPVRVQWMRAEEHGWDPKGPPTLVDLNVVLDRSGNVFSWESQFFIPQGTPSTVWLLAAGLAGLPHNPIAFPGNILQDTAIPYTISNIRTTCHLLETTPLRPSWIRTPGRMQNTFANEAFMDELAAAADVDPLEFRLRYLNDARGIELLNRLAKLAKWEKRHSPKKNPSGDVTMGRGLCYVKYELSRTYVGAIADVEVDRRSGAIRVPRVFVVHDCGQIINPDGLRNQIEGNVVMTVSRTVIERVTFDRSRVTSLDWASYPILTFPDVPSVEIELIDRPAEPPWGAGEPTGAVIPAAISNAVFDATGIRLRSVPFHPEKVKAAFEAL